MLCLGKLCNTLPTACGVAIPGRWRWPGTVHVDDSITLVSRIKVVQQRLEAPTRPVLLSCNSLPSIIRVHGMSSLSDQLQVIRCPSVGFKDENPGTSNGLNLVPIPPAFIRDARYQGDARYAKPVLLAGNVLTLAPSQGKTVFDRSLTGSPLQFRVRLFFITLHEIVGTHSYSRPSYRSQGWTGSIHPEGKCYSYNTAEDGISVVTEADVTDPAVAEQLERCLAMLRAIAAREHIQLPGTADLFLEIDQDSETCSYWFADHAHRTVFWLHTVDTDTVGLPDAHSVNHLRESYAVFSSSGELN